MPELERAELLAAWRTVDAVTIFPAVRATEFLRAVEPDTYVKGGDYTPESLNPEEAAVPARRRDKARDRQLRAGPFDHRPGEKNGAAMIRVENATKLYGQTAADGATVACAQRREPPHRGGRVRLDHGPERLRQEHPAPCPSAGSTA